MTTNPLAPVALNGATLAAFTVQVPGGPWARLTVTREGRNFLVRQDGMFLAEHSEPDAAMADALNRAGWLVPVQDFVPVD